MTTKEYKVKVTYQPGDKVWAMRRPWDGDTVYISQSTISCVSIIINHERDKEPRESILYYLKGTSSGFPEDQIFPNLGIAILHTNMMGWKIERDE